MRTPAEVVRHFRRQRAWTRRLVAAVPDDHFDWTPAANSFSCGDLVRHLMQAELFWRKLMVLGASGERFDPFEFSGDAAERLEALRKVNLESSHRDSWGSNPSECLERWQAIETETVAAFAGLPDAAMDVEIEHPILGVREPLATMFVLMFEHEAHHRGQLSAYLKAMGIEQPLGTYEDPDGTSRQSED